jgi:hypothetical protein
MACPQALGSKSEPGALACANATLVPVVFLHNRASFNHQWNLHV